MQVKASASISSVANNSIIIRWSYQVPYSSIDRIDILYSTNSSIDNATRTVNPPYSEITIENLLHNSKYYFYLITVNTYGSAPSEAYTITTKGILHKYTII